MTRASQRARARRQYSFVGLALSEEAQNPLPNNRIAAPAEQQPSRTALRFVLLIGILSFFADFTYEGSRSMLGQYLAVLQASGNAPSPGGLS
jgi:hypothetical protein